MKLVRTSLLFLLLVVAAMTSYGSDRLEIFSNDKDPAQSAMWCAVTNFTDISIGRPELLAQFQSVVTNYPASKYHETAKHTVDILRAMVAEDQAHATIAPTDLNRLPEEKRVRELLFQLRDMSNNKSLFSNDQYVGTNTVAHQLAAIGYPAVPQLIAAADNPALTRWLKITLFGFNMGSYVSYTVLTVGDCAVAILENIAGRSFKQATSPEARKVAQAWWDKFQTKGEKQMLIEGTEAGNTDSPTQAKFLLDRYPDVALASLIKGTQAATNIYTREHLLRYFEKFDSLEAVAFLDQELREGFNESPLVAAGILNRKGRPEGVTMVIQEWEKTRHDQPDNMTGPTELERFLASVDSPEAIAALGKNLRTHSLNTRMTIVNTVGSGGSEWYGPPVPKHSAATLDATEELLVTALQDAGQVMGETGSRMGKSYTDPRVCDMAGLYLNLLWPERYKFDLAASLTVRDSQRAVCQNTWRRAHNLLMLPATNN